MFDTEKSRNLVSSLPQYRLLTETDGPFTESNEVPTRPMGVEEAVDGLAANLNIAREEMRARVLKNFQTLVT